MGTQRMSKDSTEIEKGLANRRMPTVTEEIVIDKIWSAVKVGFALKTHGDIQYVAYYNENRRMVVGMRKLGDKSFKTLILPSESKNPPRRSKVTSTIQGWDSHNYITFAVDKEGYIHLAGNMHVDPLLYFRSTKPNDITTLVQVKSMVGIKEDRCTYPKFMNSPEGDLIFHYRDGSSGKGDEIYNFYDAKTKTWRRYLEKGLISGEGKMNAYQNGPVLGPDGWYHLLWMWRDTPDAATNHDLSYARSRDLKNWESAAGDQLELPLKISSKGTIIDPVPPGGGIINTIHRFGFDRQNRVVVTYHKHDEKGDTQAYAARFNEGSWMIRSISQWQGKHVFKGGGSGPSSFGTSISIGTIKKHGDSEMALPFKHWKAGSGLLVIDEETLKPLRVDPEKKKAPRYPSELLKVRSDFEGMGVRWKGDSGKSPEPSSYYVLRWETLGPNRDRPRQGALPENSDLVLYKITKK